MFPLSYANIGDVFSIDHLCGDIETIHHLEHLGFVPGSHITVVSKRGDSVIANVKEVRLAINGDMARNIFLS